MKPIIRAFGLGCLCATGIIGGLEAFGYRPLDGLPWWLYAIGAAGSIVLLVLWTLTDEVSVF